jgi:hypothetical protein
MAVAVFVTVAVTVTRSCRTSWASTQSRRKIADAVARTMFMAKVVERKEGQDEKMKEEREPAS